MLITESAAIRIDLNLARMYYFTHTTQGPCDSPNQLNWMRGTRVNCSNEAQPLRVHPACAWSNLGPPGTSLNFPTHSSSPPGDTPKPPCIARWPRIWDRASMIKSKEVIGLSVLLFGYVVAQKGAQSRRHPRTVLKRSKRTMPM